MENQKMSSGKIALNYGLVFGIILIVYSLVLYLLNINFESLKYWGYGNYVIILIGMVLGIKAYRNKYLDGFISFGKSFSTGFLIALFAAILVAIYSFFYYKFIDPGILVHIIESAEEGILESSPDISDQQLDMAMGWTKKMTSPVMLAIGGLIITVIISLIISLIVSIFMMKKDKSVEGVA